MILLMILIVLISQRRVKICDKGLQEKILKTVQERLENMMKVRK